MTTSFDPAQHPRKLNLGCGFDIRPGYLNVDLHAWHGCDLVSDVRTLDVLPSGYYEEIYASDVLEHLQRTETRATLCTWNRVLRTGGRLWLRVPSVLGLSDLLRHPEYQSVPQQELLIQNLFGTQAYQGDYHYTTFTEITLRNHLEQTGFAVQELKVMHHWLFDCTAYKVGEPTDVEALEDVLSTIGTETDDFIRAAYRRILQRDADPGGLEHYRGMLANGQLTRLGLLQMFRGSEEAKALAAANRR